MTDKKMERDENFQRMRTCAAHVYLTGAVPSHTRKSTNEWLRGITTTRARVGNKGQIQLSDEAFVDLELDSHPMVVEVQRRQAEGYRIILPTDFGIYQGTQHSQRRPAGSIYMLKGERRIIVHEDGSVFEGWASRTARRRIHRGTAQPVRHRSRADFDRARGSAPENG